MQIKIVPACIGIDIGCWTTKIAAAKRGGVEVITNQANFRETPTVVGFGATERQIGQAGNIKMKSNFRDTVVAPNRYLGIPADYPMLRAQTKYSPARTNLSSGKIMFEVNYQGQNEALTAQQVAAAYFNKMKQIVAKNGLPNQEAVISVPGYLTQGQRKAYLDAARIAQLNVTRLINDSTAIALDYGMFRKGELSKETTSRNVLFIDFGHSKFSAFVCSFTKDQMSVIQQSFQRNLGCRDIDYQMFEFYRGVFEKTSGGCDLGQSRKAAVKIMEYIEKQRKILSGISEHQISIQYLMEQKDLKYTMKRQQFQQIARPVFEAIATVLCNMTKKIKDKKIDLHSVELVGGGTRIPYLLKVVKSVFNMEPSRTLNSSESVARGCALMSAIKSHHFQVPEYGLHEMANYGIKFCWNFVKGNDYIGLNSEAYPRKQSKIIFEEGSKVPISKTIKFARKEAIQILIEYDPPINGFNKYIGYYVTKPQYPKKESFGVSFKLKHNQHGLVTFEECCLIEEWFEESKVHKKKESINTKQVGGNPDQKMDVQGQGKHDEQLQIKESKREKYTLIKYDGNTFDVNSEKCIQQFFTLENGMMNRDRLILDTYERKNELESLIYQWKQRLTQSYQDYTRPEEVPAILQFLEHTNHWLYSQGQQANRATFISKIDSVKNKISLIKNRYDTFQEIDIELTNLAQTLKQNLELVNSLDQKYTHISSKQRQEVIKLEQKVRQWAGNAENKQKGRPKWQQPVISVAEIRKYSKEFVEKTKMIMEKPMPQNANPN